MSSRDRVNLNIFTIALFTARMSDDTINCFVLQGNKDPLVLLSSWDKKIAITFHENQIVNLRNQYHKEAT